MDNLLVIHFEYFSKWKDFRAKSCLFINFREDPINKSFIELLGQI